MLSLNLPVSPWLARVRPGRNARQAAADSVLAWHWDWEELQHQQRGPTIDHWTLPAAQGKYIKHYLHSWYNTETETTQISTTCLRLSSSIIMVFTSYSLESLNTNICENFCIESFCIHPLVFTVGVVVLGPATRYTPWISSTYYIQMILCSALY